MWSRKKRAAGAEWFVKHICGFHSKNRTFSSSDFMFFCVILGSLC